MEHKAIRIAYGEALAKLGAENKRVVALDADLAHATMTVTFANAFPERFFNCGIAEANMVDIAAGMSFMGKIPFASTFAVFANRALDQIRNGVCYANANVKFAFSHAGITLGEDGGSHQAIEDIAIMRALPNMVVLVPCDAKEVEKAVFAAAQTQGPVYIRLARLPSPVFEEDRPFEIGKGYVMREGKDVTFFACGIMVAQCLQACEQLKEKGIDAGVVNLHTIKPLDRELVWTCAQRCHNLFTVEEHSVIGGLGDAVADVLAGKGVWNFHKIGIQDRFGQTGKPDAVLEEYGLSVGAIVKRVLDTLDP